LVIGCMNIFKRMSRTLAEAGPTLRMIVSCVWPDSDGYSAGTERAMLDSIGVWDIELDFDAGFVLIKVGK
jgi:hypothetical protein